MARDGDTVKNMDLLGDLTLSFVPNHLHSIAWNEVGARPVPIDGPGLCFLEEQPALDGLFAFYPEGDFVDGSAQIKVPNVAKHEPLTEVNFYVLGNLDCSVEGQEEGIEEAAWHSFGKGIVDESGLWIETLSDVGLPCLSWLGYGL